MNTYVSEQTLRSIQRVQPFVELFFGVSSFMTNIYFALKFGSLTQYHPNLRIIMVISS